MSDNEQMAVAINTEAVQALRDLADMIESGYLPADTNVAVVYGNAGGTVWVRGIGAGMNTVETIGMLDVGKHIMLNQFAPRASAPVEQTPETVEG